MDHKLRKKIISIGGIILILLVYFLVQRFFPGFLPKTSSDQVKLIECVDGDTARLNINGKDERVRFLAIDAPEIAHDGNPADPYGNEASDYTCKRLKTANSIRLEYEAEKTDKFGRVLAWVFVDDKLLNEEVVSKGLAKVAYLYDKYKYTPQIQKAERSAKNSKLNIWK